MQKHYFGVLGKYTEIFANFAADLWCPSADSIGNRVRIPYSSRCCVGYNACHDVTESHVFREGGKKRPQSEDLPQVAKQGFRELELGFYI